MIDVHCHIETEAWTQAERRDLIEQGVALGIQGWINGGTSPEQWKRQKLVVQTSPYLWSTYGIHPWEAAQSSDLEGMLEELWSGLEEKGSKVVGLGEVGLDRMRRYSEGEGWRRQKEAFHAQIEMAKLRSLPMVLHIVRAYDEALKIVKMHEPLQIPLVIHGARSSKEMLEQWIRRGAYLSIGYDIYRSRRLREVLLKLSMERLLLETDAPYQRFKGVEEPLGNRLLGLSVLYREIAVLFQVDVGFVEEVVDGQVRKIFSI